MSPILPGLSLFERETDIIYPLELTTPLTEANQGGPFSFAEDYFRQAWDVNRSMAGSRNRARLLHLIHLFHAETDEEHYLSLKEIRERLEDVLREPVSLRAITDDIQFLSQQNRVLEMSVAHGEKRYSMPRSEFEIHELRLLIDAIASARSITPNETQRLIHKIQSLTSRHLGKKLENQIYLDRRVKESNERLK